MISQEFHALFWDINLDEFNPVDYPKYTLGRILELGDEEAVAWMRQTFSEEEITKVIRTERRLSRRSANFWALVYSIPPEEVAALQPALQLTPPLGFYQRKGEDCHASIRAAMASGSPQSCGGRNPP